MPRPKLLPYKDGPKRYRVEIPKIPFQRQTEKKKHFFPTLEQSEPFLRAFKAQRRDLGTSVLILRPAESIDAASAIRLLRRHAEKHGIRQPNLPDVAYA